MDERQQRIGENEVFWRQLNELQPPERGAMNLVFCECGRTGCAERVSITAQEYEAVRSSPLTFLVVPGHELNDAERVIETTDRFNVVEKGGEAAVVAIETDPS